MRINLLLLFHVIALPLVAQFNFSNGTLILRQNDQNKFGFTDQKGNWIIEAKYDEAMEIPLIDAAVVYVDSQYRFINPSGKFVNDLHFDELFFTRTEGDLLAYAKKNGKWGAIDGKFKERIPFEYEIKTYDEFIAFYVDGGASYLEAKSPLVCKKGNYYGAIDAQNKELLAFQYDQIEVVRSMGSAPEWYALSLKGKWAVVKAADVNKADFRYDDFLETNQDSICVVKKRNKWLFLNMYTGVEKTELGPNGENILLDVRKQGKWGRINGKGLLVVDFVSDYVLPHKQIYTRYHFKHNLNHDFSISYGMLDPTGKVMLEPDYEEIQPVDNMFIMQREGFKGLISDGGVWVMPPFNQDVKHLCLDLFAVKTMDKYKVFDNYGSKVYPNPVDEVFCSEEIMFVRKQDRWGAITKTGKPLIPFQYESLSDGFHNGLCIAKFEGKYGLINRNGETALFFDYDEVDPNFNYYRSSKTEKFKYNGKWMEVELPLIK